MDGKTFGNSEEYYGENAERRYSVEADYGFHWRLDGEPERWRVSRNDGRKALRETWRESTVTWVCSFCLDDEDHRFVLPAADARGVNSQNRQLSAPTVSGPTASGPPR